MKWSGNGESKVRGYLSIALAGYTEDGELTSAILFGDDYLVALRTLEEAQQRRRYDLRFDNVYRHIHFIPLNEFGIKQLRTIVMRDWYRTHMDIIYGEDAGEQFGFFFEHDALIEGVAHVSFIDGDLCKLIRVKDALKANKDLRYDIVCYPEQLSMVREYLVEFRGTGRLGLRTVNIDDAIKVLFAE